MVMVAFALLLILLAAYVFAYLPDFRRNRREAIFAFVVILPLTIIGGWALYGFFMWLFMPYLVIR